MIKTAIIRKLDNGKYRLYSRKIDPKTHKRKNLGTFPSLKKAKEHEKDIHYFKHHADDGKTESRCNKILKLMSDMAGYLEEAGFIDASQNVYDAMYAVDGSLSNDEDYAYDMTASIPDVQNALPGSVPYKMTGEVAGGMQGLFSVPATTFGCMMSSMVALADRLDQLKCYSEADELDRMVSDMANIIGDLEQSRKGRDKARVEKQEEDKAGVGAIVDANGHFGNSVDQTAGFSGFIDTPFYQHYQNLEGRYGG